MPTFEARQSLPEFLNSILIAGIVFNQTPGIILLDAFPDIASVPPTTVVNFNCETPLRSLIVTASYELTGHIVLEGPDLRVCNHLRYDGLPPLIDNVAGGVLLSGELDLIPGTEEFGVTSVVTSTHGAGWLRIWFESQVIVLNPNITAWLEHWNGLNWVNVAGAVIGPAGSIHCTGLGIYLSTRIRYTGPDFTATNYWGYGIAPFDVSVPFP